jgi:uncharacterized protein (DUF2336 family)
MSRKELLRQVTQALGQTGHTSGELVAYDNLLSKLASDYSTQVRAELAKLVAKSNSIFTCSAQLFAMDEIEAAGPVLEQFGALSDSTLLRVISEKSQGHLLAVTRRRTITEHVSQALVEKGNDQVVSALLENGGACINAATFEAVAPRAQTCDTLQAPLVNRTDIPISLLNNLYVTVEKALRPEIVRRIGSLSPGDIETAFQNSRDNISKVHGDVPADMRSATKRIDALKKQGGLLPPFLITLLREVSVSRTAFKLAFARLVDVPYGLIQRVVDGRDLDTLALLCRGSNFERAFFVSLAMVLDGQDRGLGGVKTFAELYESVPVLAAERAIRFWKVRAAA